MSGRAQTLAIDLGVYVALAWFAAAHWGDGLVAGAPGVRVFACVVVGAAAGVALSLTAEMRSLPARLALRAGCVLAAIGAGLVAIGLDRHFLAPGHWDEFADGLDRGFAALGAAEWPYAGPEEWTRLALLLAIPIVLSLAAAFAFWPGRRLRPVGLALLVALYGMAVTEHQFGGELARGAALLLLVAAWLWLPRMPEQGMRMAAVAAGVVLVACVAALPAAARYDDGEPWIDYEAWNPFEAQAATHFDWTHSYGPIDWPRDGTTLLNVRSDKRHYWRVETLDYFDGFGWARSGGGHGNSPLLPREYRKEWESRFRVTIRELDTEFFPVAGTPIQIKGANPVVVPNEDGTMEAVAGSLDEGDSYEVLAYVPDPTPDQMRAAPRVYPGTRLPYIPGELVPYTDVYLPPPGTTALEGTGRAGDAARSARDEGQLPATTAEILDSPYARVLRLARRLARGRETHYDVVRAVQGHLRAEYTYSERPPSQEFPLAAFLFEDRIGYCQQFSGAMALMLRMLGIPTRVAAGFTPGSYNRDTKEYRVRDLDAHSWVEVWFPDIGWVPFDPTPSVAPAESQSSADAPSASGGAADAGETPDPRGGQSSSALSERAGDPGGGAGGGPADPAVEGWTVLAGLALLALAALATGALRVRVRLRGSGLAPEERELADLRRGLARLGQPVPPSQTLRQLESRLEHDAGPPAARYVRMLRECRYAPDGGRAPGSGDRRALRRALARGRGVRGRLRALLALPPVAFRRG